MKKVCENIVNACSVVMLSDPGDKKICRANLKSARALLKILNKGKQLNDKQFNELMRLYSHVNTWGF